MFCESARENRINFAKNGRAANGHGFSRNKNALVRSARSSPSYRIALRYRCATTVSAIGHHRPFRAGRPRVFYMNDSHACDRRSGVCAESDVFFFFFGEDESSVPRSRSRQHVHYDVIAVKTGRRVKKSPRASGRKSI